MLQHWQIAKEGNGIKRGRKESTGIKRGRKNARTYCGDNWQAEWKGTHGMARDGRKGERFGGTPPARGEVDEGYHSEGQLERECHLQSVYSGGGCGLKMCEEKLLDDLLSE